VFELLFVVVLVDETLE